MCESPRASVQVTLTASPGEWAATAFLSRAEVLTRVEPIAVIRSPPAMPALSAGVPSYTPSTVVPLWARPTPRNAGDP